MHRRKLIISVAIALAIAVASTTSFLVIDGRVSAAAHPGHLNYGPQLTAAQCGNGASVINVTFKVINDPDSSVTGHYWANDSYNRQLQVWQIGTNSFCAIASYEGTFVTVSGNSPADTDPSIPADITGNIHGGYRATFTGTLALSPNEPTHGNLGTFNYHWDGTDAGASNITPFDWTTVYFGGYPNDFNQYWWGWIYHTPHNGDWVNACSVTEQGNAACPGNTGDITG